MSQANHQRANKKDALKQHFRTVPELRGRTLDWIVYPILHNGSITILYGEPNTYKSFIALDLALSVSTGTHFLRGNVEKFYTPHARQVVYLAGESIHGWYDRIRAWSRFRKFSDDTNTLQFPNLHFLPVSLNLADQYSGDGDTDSLIDAMKEHTNNRSGVLVIDTLSVYFGGHDENEGPAAQQFLKSCRKIMSSGAAQAILVIHHQPKSQGGLERRTPRGHSKLTGDADILVHVSQQTKNTKNNLTNIIDLPENDENHDLRIIAHSNKKYENLTSTTAGAPTLRTKVLLSIEKLRVRAKPSEPYQALVYPIHDAEGKSISIALGLHEPTERQQKTIDLRPLPERLLSAVGFSRNQIEMIDRIQRHRDSPPTADELMKLLGSNSKAAVQAGNNRVNNVNQRARRVFGKKLISNVNRRKNVKNDYKNMPETNENRVVFEPTKALLSLFDEPKEFLLNSHNNLKKNVRERLIWHEILTQSEIKEYDQIRKSSREHDEQQTDQQNEENS
jgi:hypothetical protein